MLVIGTKGAIPKLRLEASIVEKAAALHEAGDGGPTFAVEATDESGVCVLAVLRAETHRTRRRLAYAYNDLNGGAFLDELTESGDRWIDSLGDSLSKQRIMILGEVAFTIALD